LNYDCNKPVLNNWLVRRALGNQASGTNRTWVVTEAGSDRVVAFYASSTASIIRSSAPKAFGRNQPAKLPPILLGRMAVDVSHAGQGLGAALLKHFMLKAVEVAVAVGVRVLLVHVKDDEAKHFYEHYGFTESPVDPMTLLMLLPSR
jgi:GNAT superfamily N-acetyltransferase